MYGKTKRALDCLENYNLDDIEFKCKKHRIYHSRNIIKINQVDLPIVINTLVYVGVLDGDQS